MTGAPGVMPIETSVAEVTLSVVVPDTPAVLAVMALEPEATALARPEALMVATAVLTELQLTLLDTSCFTSVAINTHGGETVV